MYLMTQMNLEINLNILLIWREELPSSKLIISIIVFSFLFFLTSIIKNKTRIIEKDILYEKKISYLEKELHESQLDFHYLTSPEILQSKIAFLTSDEYQHMSFLTFILITIILFQIKKKFQKNNLCGKKKNKKNFNTNQQSFLFEDYISTKQRFIREKNFIINEDRIYILFFSFFSLILIFSLKIIFISFQNSSYNESSNFKTNFKPIRNDIIDRNGVLLSRNIIAYHAAIKPNLIKDKKKFLVKIKLALPEIETKILKKNLSQKKYFYLKKRLTETQRGKLWKLGEKGIIFEPFQTRVYPHSGLYSHIIGQIDYDNYGISGVENYYDNYLRDQKNSNRPLQLSLDTNIQFIIKQELEDALKLFKAQGAASLLMNSENGEVLSLVSLPDYNINKRNDLKDKVFMNKITKGVFELGSIFKTFTVALALNEKIVDAKTVINNIQTDIKCSVHKISDIKKFPNL